MTFPLMRGYDQIRVVADLDPVGAARDAELGERMREHPKLFPAGSPDFGFAIQTGPLWRIGTSGGGDPEGSRRALASHLRQRARDMGDTKVRRAMRAAADRLDPPDGGAQLAKDEWEIGRHRYRVIRIEKFTLIGSGVMEPPRVTDTDPPPQDRLLTDHLIDPLAAAGQWEVQLRLNLVDYQHPAGLLPRQIEAEAWHAVHTHPGVVLLPPTYTVVEIEGDSWNPLTGGEGPDEARANLAAHFTQLLPRLRKYQGEPATPAELAEWDEAAEQIHATPGPEFNVLNRRFRTVRVSRYIRLGKDGPEGPRPSDQSRYGWDNC